MTTQNPLPYANHNEVWELLPWYVNGTLHGTETERLRNHLRVCLTCRREVAAQMLLYRRLSHEPRVEISAQPSFERLMSRIEKEDRGQRPLTLLGTSPAIQRWQEILGWLRTPSRLSVALACALLAALSLPLLVRETPVEPTRSYRTVANTRSFQEFAPHDVRVAFTDNVTEREIQALVESMNGEIADGPNGFGVYTVRLKDSDAGEPAYSRFLVRLRGNKAVSFAEPAIPPASPKSPAGD